MDHRILITVYYYELKLALNLFTSASYRFYRPCRLTVGAITIELIVIAHFLSKPNLKNSVVNAVILNLLK